MDQGPVGPARFPVVVHETLPSGAFPAEILSRHAGSFAERPDTHVLRNGAGIVRLIGAPDGKEDGIGPVRMGLDAHVTFTEAGKHVVSSRDNALFRDCRLVVEPFGIPGREVIEEVDGRSAPVPVAVADLVLRGIVELPRKGRPAGVEAGNPEELGPFRLRTASLDVHADIPRLLHLEIADVKVPRFRHPDPVDLSVAGEGEIRGLGAGGLRRLESEVQGAFPFRPEKQRKHGGRVIPGLQRTFIGVDDLGRLLVNRTVCGRDEDVSPEGDDAGVRCGFEGGGRRIPAGCGHKGGGKKKFE